MNAPLQLSRTEARQTLFDRQGLVANEDSGPRVPGREDVLAMIRRMGVLQIDTIHVVARSPYLVLWSRLGDYAMAHLDDSLRERQIFEYWSHEASFLPVEDLAIHRRHMLDAPKRKSDYYRNWIDANPGPVERVRAVLAANGEARSADFARDMVRPGQGWWDWKPEKLALEFLFMLGEVTVIRRERFHRIYAPWKDAFPDWDDDRVATAEEAADQQALLAVQALGAGTANWIADYFRRPKIETRLALQRLVTSGQVIPAQIEGQTQPAFADPTLSTEPGTSIVRRTGTRLLSPFDPVVWDRDRARGIFDFDYRIECYTPAAKRRFGYFCLPILHDGKLVGRLDAKAHRIERRLEIKSLHLEPDIIPDADVLEGIAGCLREFASWQSLDDVTITFADPAPVAPALNTLLSSA